MNDVLIFEPQINSNIKRILFLCDCPEYSASYSTMEEEAQEVVARLQDVAVPKASLYFSETEIDCVVTIGQEASNLSGMYFHEGDCVKGLLADNACDDLIFELEEQLTTFLKKECQKRGIGIKRRLEAPQDLPMSEQRGICQRAQAEGIGVTLLESLMLAPVKSSCCKYLVSDKCSDFHAEHDCSSCPCLDCKMRNKNQ